MLHIPDLLPCKCNIYWISFQLDLKSKPVKERRKGVRRILSLWKKSLTELVEHAKFSLGNWLLTWRYVKNSHSWALVHAKINMHCSKRKTGKRKEGRLTLSLNEKHQAFVFASMNGFLKGHKSSSNTSAPLHALIDSQMVLSTRRTSLERVMVHGSTAAWNFV